MKRASTGSVPRLRSTAVLTGTIALLAAAMAPAAAQAGTCVDHKPATGFSFTCDTALASAIDAANTYAFEIRLPNPDDWSTLTVATFSVPGFHCVRKDFSVIGCDGPVMPGQTVTGTITWKIRFFHAPFPVGNCVTGDLAGEPAPYDYHNPQIHSPLRVCQSSSPTTPPGPTANLLTASSARRAAKAALLKRFGRSWRKGSAKKLTCSPVGKKFRCKVSWRYHAKRHKGRVIVSVSGGKLRTRVRVH